jgi:hypothetical protein
MSGVVGQNQWNPCRRERIRGAWGVKGKQVAAHKCKGGPDGTPCLQCTLNRRQSDGNFKLSTFLERLLPYQKASVRGNIVMVMDPVTDESVYRRAPVIDQILICNYLNTCGHLYLVEPPLCYIPKPNYSTWALQHDQCVINDCLVTYQDTIRGVEGVEGGHNVTIVVFPGIYANTGLTLIEVPREKYTITTSKRHYQYKDDSTSLTLLLKQNSINTYLSHWIKDYWHLRVKGGNKTARVEQIEFSPTGEISLI